MSLAAAEFDFGLHPGSNIHYRANDLDASGVTTLRFSNNVQVFDSPVWHQQANLKINTFAPGGGGYRLLHRGHILRMNALHNHRQRDFRRRVEFQNAERLVGPEVLVGGNVPFEATCFAEPLGFGQTMLATPQGLFDALALLDVGYDPIPFDDVSTFISQWPAAVQMPSILPIRSAKPNLGLIRFAAGNGRASFAFVVLEIVGMGHRSPA